MLSGKDLPRHNEAKIDKARVDQGIWVFPHQFDEYGDFITNGPGERVVRSSFTI